MTLPTDQELAEMQARCEAATPEPWVHEGGRLVRCRPQPSDTVPMRCTEDALWVVHARTDLPRLIAAMKELRAEVARLTEELSGCRDAKIRAQSSGDQTRAEVERLRKVEAAARAYRSHFGHEAFRSYVRSEGLNVLDDILAGRGPGGT